MRQRSSWRHRLQRFSVRASAPVVVLAVAGAVVAFGFGYAIIGEILGVAVVAGLILVSVIHQRRGTETRDRRWWR
ncbi:MAG: hypothetical protein WA751_01405 [Candidatus Dormiibacterota bacterium]